MIDSIYERTRQDIARMVRVWTAVTEEKMTNQQARRLVNMVVNDVGLENLKWLIAAYQYEENLNDLTTNKAKRRMIGDLVTLATLTNATSLNNLTKQ